MPDLTMGLTGGYTAGHVMPMLALAEAWGRLYPRDAIVCYGAVDGIEATLVRQFGVPFHPLPAHPDFGAGMAGRIRARLSALHGMRLGRRHMRRHQVDGLICLGGYASLGAGLAAASLGRPLIVLEANAVPGRTNALLARFADLKLVAMPEALGFGRWRDARVVDLPLRLHPGTTPPPRGLRPRLLITGGTFGSPTLNRAGAALAETLWRRGLEVEVYHQAGEKHQAEVQAAYAQAGIPAAVVGFDLALAERWAWADAAICAGGAGSLCEAAASGTPTLAVPISAVADSHQEANARAMASRHGIAWIPERKWRTAEAAECLSLLLRRPKAHPPAASGTDDTVQLVRALCLGRHKGARGP